MRSTTLLASALTLIMAGTAAAHAQYGPPPPPQQGYGQGGYGQGGYGQGGWDNAPQEFREAMRRGFHDGIEGARRDFQNHRQPNVNNRDEFRHPPMSGPDRHDYREGFRRGYSVGVRHIYGDQNRSYGPDRY